MLSLLASLAALGLGPALLAAAQGRRGVLRAVDGFVVVTIGGIVLLHILPHAFAIGGWPVLLLAATGLLAPSLFERYLGSRLPQASRWVLLLALVGLSLHALIDGTVLSEAHGGHQHEHGAHESLMALGVILHRVPEGLAIWWAFRLRHGPRGVALALLVIGGATTLGFVLGERLENLLGPLHGVQALVAGSLLHVLFHPPHDDDDPEAHAVLQRFTRPAAIVGALLGLALLGALSLAHPGGH